MARSTRLLLVLILFALPAWAVQVERISIKVDHLTFDASSAGPPDGELVLLLHGFPQTSHAFRHLMSPLANRGFRVVAPDQRGYSPGARPDAVEAYGMQHLVGDVIGIADALGYQSFHLVGHDWGGAVAWVTALRYPDRVRSLTVLSTPHPRALGRALSTAGSDQAKRSSYFSSFAEKGSEKRFLSNDARFLRDILTSPGITAKDQDDYLSTLGEEDALRAALNWYRALVSSRASPAKAAPAPSRAFRVPTLYMWGEGDQAFGRAAAEASAEFVDGYFEFHPLPGVGHWIAEDATDLTNELIVRHLDRFSGTASLHRDTTRSSYEIARIVLDRAIEAVGGEAALAKRGASAEYSGTRQARGQSRSIEPPWENVSLSGRFLIDGRGRVRFEQRFVIPGGTDRSFESVIDGDEGWNYWISRRLLTRIGPGDSRFIKSRPNLYPIRALPHLLLGDAARNAASLRWVGRENLDGNTVDRIVFTGSDGIATTLVVAEDGVLDAIEQLTGDLILGDTTARVIFRGMSEVDGVQMPGEIRFALGDRVLETWSLSNLKVGAQVADAEFERPSGVELTDPVQSFQPRPVADGVWAIRLYSGPANSYNTMLVEFEDFLVVVDTPLVDIFQRVVTNIASQLAPGKPIRYVIPTHEHLDHIGGIRGYLANEAIAIATEHVSGAIRRLAETHSSIQPNPLEGKSPKLQVFESRVVIADASRELHVIDVGPGPHAESMTIAYLPNEKVLFVADLFALPDNGAPLPSTETTRDFARKLGELGLDVETVVPAHGLAGSGDDLWKNLGGRPSTVIDSRDVPGDGQ